MANSFIASGQNMQRRPWRKSILKIGACSWRSHKQATLYRNTQCVRLVSTETPSETAPRVIFSGIQPTGVPHLGNYFGAIRPWVKFQNERLWNDELYFSVVDLHALTVPQEPKQLEEWRLDTYFALLAAGLDPKLCRIFFQSEVSHVLPCSTIVKAYGSRCQDIQSLCGSSAPWLPQGICHG